jgi:hypothetical protein
MEKKHEIDGAFFVDYAVYSGVMRTALLCFVVSLFAIGGVGRTELPVCD